MSETARYFLYPPSRVSLTDGLEMSHTFTIISSDEISSLLIKVESAITASGGSFDGDEERGVFFGKTPLGFIRGEYCCTNGKEIAVTIVDKPFFVPNGVIELKIREYFS